MKDIPFKDDYAGCLKNGKIWEHALESFIKSLGCNIFRNDKNDYKLPDFGLNLCFDLKFRGSVFRMAKKYVGLDPSEAIAIDANKLGCYAKIAGSMIVVIVDYRPELNTHGLFLIRVEKILSLMGKYGESRMHYYKSRQDSSRHSNSSFFVSTAECIKLPDIFFDMIVSEMKKAQA